MTTRDRLIEAAREHLREYGLVGLSLRSVARAVGVSHAAPARHFNGVASLLSAVAAQSFQLLTETIENQVANTSESPLAQLASAGEAYIQFALAHPAEYELMFRPERLDRTDVDYLEASLGAFDCLANLVADAQTDGWRGDVDRMLLVGIVWSSVHGLATLLIQGALANATGITEPEPFVMSMIQSLIDPSPLTTCRTSNNESETPVASALL